MDLSRVNETRLVNCVGFNLARLATNDGIDFEEYVNSTRKITSAYLGYNHELTPAKVSDITQQRFTNQVRVYIEGKELDIGNYLVLSKAYVLYFLGYDGFLDERIREVEKLVVALRGGRITPTEARETLDTLVAINLNSRRDISKAIESVSQEFAGASR